MLLHSETTLIDAGGFSDTDECQVALDEIRTAIAGVRWPPGSSDFTIYPESGKKSNEGNGVRPIRDAFVERLKAMGWTPEAEFPLKTAIGGAKFGAMDAAKVFGELPPFMVEWETGNISSSHRALNKMGLGLRQGAISGGVLIVPTRELAQYLTDRIGNLRELVPYFPLWSSIPVDRGWFSIFAVQHDATSFDVPRITKGTDGRALL